MADGATRVHGARRELERLLDQLLESPERRIEISAEIDRLFGRRRAVMVLDMSGFSRTTQRQGIVSFLLMIHQMHLLARPIIAEYHGDLVKEEADNLFCLFETVDTVIGASLAIKNRLKSFNCAIPEDRRLYVSFGVGFGDILYIGNEDLFGNEVNLASKLGEDIAENGDILLTTAALAALRDPSLRTREEVVGISGLSLTYYKVIE